MYLQPFWLKAVARVYGFCSQSRPSRFCCFMVVARRIDHIRQLVSQGTKVVASVSGNPSTQVQRVRFVITPRARVEPALQSGVCCLLDLLSNLPSGSSLADRGHKHSNGVSDVTFYITRNSSSVPDGPHADDMGPDDHADDMDGGSGGGSKANSADPGGAGGSCGVTQNAPVSTASINANAPSKQHVMAPIGFSTFSVGEGRIKDSKTNQSNSNAAAANAPTINTDGCYSSPSGGESTERTDQAAPVMATESYKLTVPELVSIFERRPQVKSPTVMVDEWRSIDYDVAVKRLVIINRHSTPTTSLLGKRGDSATDNVAINTDYNIAIKRLHTINNHCNPPPSAGQLPKRRRRPKNVQPDYSKIANAVANNRLTPSPCGKGWTITT